MFCITVSVCSSECVWYSSTRYVLFLFRVLLFSYSNFFFFKQKTAYEMRISDWSSDVCSSDLGLHFDRRGLPRADDHLHAADGQRERVARENAAAMVRRDVAPYHQAEFAEAPPLAVGHGGAVDPGDPHHQAESGFVEPRRARKSVVEGTSETERMDPGGSRPM